MILPRLSTISLLAFYGRQWYNPKVDNSANPSAVMFNSFTSTPMVVNKALEKLEPYISAGPDGLSNMRNCSSSSFQDSSWKSANILPIHKKGSTSAPNNLKPISLTATCCQVMERMLNEQLLNCLLTNKLITKHRHRFICGKLTSKNLPECVNDWSLDVPNCAAQILFILISRKTLIRSCILNFLLSLTHTVYLDCH
jgi:hypothetical protein